MRPRRAKKSVHRSRRISRPAPQKKQASLRSRPVLHEERQNWKAVFDSSQDGIMIADIARKRFLSCNQKITRMLGFSEAELLGLSAKDIHPPQELRRALAGFNLLARGRASVVSDIPIRRKNGSIFYADISGSCVEFFGRKCLVGFFRDVTPRKEAEKALLESEGRFRKIVENAPMAMAIVSTKGVIEIINQKATQVFGYLPKDIPTMERWWVQAYPDKDYRNEVIADWMGRVERGIASGSEIKGNEYRVTCKDRTVKTIFISGASIAGKVFVLFDDITVRKEAEMSLRESENRYRTLVETTGIGYVILNSKGRVLDANQEYVHLSGHRDLKQIRGRSVIEWTSSAEKGNNAKAIRRCLIKGHVKDFETVYVDKHGATIAILINAAVIGSGEAKCILTLCQDITGRKRAEEEIRQALSLKRATLESTADGILVVDGLTGKVMDFNDRFSKLWKIPGKVLRSGEDKRLLRCVLSQLKDPGRFLSRVKELYRYPRRKSFDVLEFKDGRIFERYSHAQLLDGKPVGRVWSFRDVTQHKHMEADLQASEQRYRGIFEFSHDAMTTLQPPSWKFTSANVAMVRMFRAKDVAQLRPHSPWALSPNRQPDGRASVEKAKEMIRIAIRKGSHFFEWMHRRLDGVTFPAEVLLTQIARDGGVLLQATIRDITERKRAENAVRSSERRLTDLMANLPGVVYRCKNERDWPMLFVSEGCLSLTGHRKKDFESRRVLYNDLIYREDQGRIWNAVQKALARKTYFEFVYRIRTKKSEEKWIWERGHGVWNDSGKLMYLDGFVTDITARQQAEDFLREHRHQLSQVIDAVPHMIFAEDGKGRFLLVNRAVARAYGVEPRELIGVRRQDVHEVREEVEGYLKVDKEILAIGRSRVIPEEFFTDSQGRKHILQTIRIPFKMVGVEEKCILGVSVDVTEQKKIEEFRNDIVRTVSHELRTPLSIQKEGISLLRDEIAGPVNKEQQGILDAVMRNIDRLARMITSLLDISSIESGQIKLAKKVIDLMALVKEVVPGFMGRAGEKAIDLSVKLPRQPVRVFADPDKIAQVVSNMVDNALKFTAEKGTVEVSLTLLKRDVECEVRDSGVGIAPEHLGKLFEKFQQFSRTVGPGEKGFGLGLSIAKGIIDLHGGRIRVQSKIGQGTRVAFLLPLYIAEESRRSAGKPPCPKKEI